MTLRSLLIPLGLSLCVACASAPPTIGKYVLPTSFRENRIFVTPRLASGAVLEFYTDSGGGWNAVLRNALDPAALATIVSVEVEGGRRMSLVDFPAFAPGQGLPPSASYFMEGRLAVVVDAGELLGATGFLGARWFADKVWEFDYPAKSLTLLTRWQAPRDASHRAALGFQTNAAGARTMHFPRITVRIDEADLDLLLDTGATAELPAESSRVFGLPEGSRVGASYITKSIFERWVARHPDWLVLADGDRVVGRALPMIRVPQITVAGQRAGPVWFTQRPDRNFRESMSNMMDAPIDGAIGGSALQYFRMVIDYPSAEAYFYTRP